MFLCGANLDVLHNAKPQDLCTTNCQFLCGANPDVLREANPVFFHDANRIWQKYRVLPEESLHGNVQTHVF